jgi:hypothetical protein
MSVSRNDDDLLKEIRKRFDYATEQWKDIYAEGATDMKFRSGDPWPSSERMDRERNGRPCLALDELGQYINSFIGNFRQNPRSLKVIPEGAGANDKSAELRSDLIRQIEYKSKAIQAYTTAMENALSRSYGFFRISRQYVSPDSFEQELVIRRIPNPDTILIDPDCKEADSSDMRFAFVRETIPRDEFKRSWPNAEIKNFEPEHIKIAPAWIKEEQVQVAEYWKIRTAQKTLLLLGNQQQTRVYSDDLPDGAEYDERGQRVLLPDGSAIPVLQTRVSSVPQVCQYLTNGLEILEENEWPGKYIPIFPVFGAELYVDDGTGAKRRLLSLIRLARDPYMLYCYYRTCEA